MPTVQWALRAATPRQTQGGRLIHADTEASVHAAAQEIVHKSSLTVLNQNPGAKTGLVIAENAVTIDHDGVVDTRWSDAHRNPPQSASHRIDRNTSAPAARLTVSAITQRATSQ
jgi:hypothetical protein